MTQKNLLKRFKALVDTMSDAEVTILLQHAEMVIACRGTKIRPPRADEWALLPEDVREQIYQDVMVATAEQG